MFRTVNKISLFFIGSICSAAVTACTPTYQTSAYDQGGYGFDQAEYGYDYVSGQSAYGYEQGAYDFGAAQGFNANFSSRYGEAFSEGAALRGPCAYTQQSCGMMRVVPVYPIYQVTVPQAPQVQAVEVPTITLPDPEPLAIEIYEPEPEPPVYEPVTNFWPETDAPVESWKPLRK